MISKYSTVEEILAVAVKSMTIIRILFKFPSGFTVCVLVLQENRGLLECAWHAGSGVTHFFNLTSFFKAWPGCRDTKMTTQTHPPCAVLRYSNCSHKQRWHWGVLRATTSNNNWLTPCHRPSFTKQTQLTRREIRFSGGYRVSATCVTPKWNYQLIIICRRSAVYIC